MGPKQELNFNENKSKDMLMSCRRRTERKEREIQGQSKGIQSI
jgi:hypothetical protein